MPARHSSTSLRINAALRRMQDNRTIFAALLCDQLIKEEKRLRLDFDSATCPAERAEAYGPLMRCREAVLRVLLYPKPPPCPKQPFQRTVEARTETMMVTDAAEPASPAPEADSGT